MSMSSVVAPGRSTVRCGPPWLSVGTLTAVTPRKTTPLSYMAAAASVTRNCDKNGFSLPSLSTANGSPTASYLAKLGSGTASVPGLKPVAGSTCRSCCSSAVLTRSFFMPAAPTRLLALARCESAESTWKSNRSITLVCAATMSISCALVESTQLAMPLSAPRAICLVSLYTASRVSGSCRPAAYLAPWLSARLFSSDCMLSRSRSPSASSLLASPRCAEACLQLSTNPASVPSRCMVRSSVAHDSGSYSASRIVRTTAPVSGASPTVPRNARTSVLWRVDIAAAVVAGAVAQVV
jgi:hypothetical protein